ncbi:serine/threonine-protein kinase [Nonomuraea sp. JJY05]|uniref:serine/threonine-protein kinase n=1 Tax=Nonomuraea sp. JJY05 TaxID=3350255 RepID=UPI00373EB60B
MDPLAPGDPRQIGRYRLGGRLGAGGMGEVFWGLSPSGRAVAVKLVRHELGRDLEFRRRFAQEVEAAKRVSGFHTAPVVDADPDAVPPWLVTAYVPGPSLSAVLRLHHALPESSLRILAAGLAEALEAIHRAGVVHRDLKPANILLAHDGPRVIDFGIARALDATSPTQASAVIGTPGFMAPEQVTGGAITPAADVFAFGLVLCHAAGGLPYGAGHPAALLHRVVTQEPDVSALPPSLRDVAARCLHRDPDRRPSPHQILDLLGDSAPVRDWLPAPVGDLLSQHALPQLRASPSPTLMAPPAVPDPQPGRGKVGTWIAVLGLLVAFFALINPSVRDQLLALINGLAGP